jgi:hypothetical protein
VPKVSVFWMTLVVSQPGKLAAVNRPNFWWRLRSLFGATLRDHAIWADSHSAHMEASMIGALNAALTFA